MQAGKLLGRIALDDPASVQHFKVFMAALKCKQRHPQIFPTVAPSYSSLGQALLVLEGFEPLASPKSLAAVSFSS